MARTASNFQISGREGGRHWLVPVSRLVNLAIDPTLTGEDLAENHHPVAISSRTAAQSAVGTVLSQQSVDGTDFVVVDLTPNVVYRHNVRNVRTYDAGAENSWGVISVGDVIYFDNSATMPAGVFLSTSPLNNLGESNVVFGVVMHSGQITLPTTVATAVTVDVPVAQVGLSLAASAAAVVAGGAVDTVQLVDDAVTAAKIDAGALDGEHVGLLADDDTDGGIPLLFPIAIAGGAAAAKNITVAEKIRVVDAWVQMNGAGEASDTVVIGNAGNAICTIATGAAADMAIVRTEAIDDANATIASGGSLRVTTTDNDTGDDVPPMTVYVLAMHVS